jgi:tetratricopeptide (TPR) repeat protein
VRTLTRWEELEVADTEPRSRLVPHFARSRRWEALLSRLDTLFQLTPEGTEGWVRAVVQALDEADHGPDPDLAAFYMELARRAGSPAQRLVLVTRAAEMFDASGEPESAFAAASQALALAGPDDGLLSLAERLVGPAGAAAKLDAIYDRFTEPGVSFELRKTLVLRHSVLLGATGRYGDALDRLLRVSSVAPVDLELLDALEMVASRSGRLPEVLSAYEDRTAMVGTGDRGVLLMLRAALLCFAFDRAHDVLRFFARAIDLCDASPELLAHVEKTADDLGRSAVEHIMTVYEAAAGKTADDELAADYLVRSARAMLKISPEAVDAALGLLKRALALSPTAEWVLDELETVAIAGARVEQLDEHYEEVIAQTMSDAVAAALLRRRGKILHAHIGRPSDAADVYLRLWALRPDDPDVFRAIRVCLIETGRIQELISATERELDHRENETQRLQLMCDVAALWEEAKNPWEALDAWKRVLEVAPDDARAKEAIDRIGRSKGRDAAES